MDKYEYRIRAEEIKTLISKKKYAEAAKVADTIDWSRVKSIAMLCTVSDVYKLNRRFEDARLLLEMANERHPAGRMILYSLCDLSIKMGEVVEAIRYYKDFIQIAPTDSGRYVLQYKIYEAQDVGLEERIAVLEELKKRDRREKWMYELAYLYHRVGLATKCVEECDELILWFGEGKYVLKAMELKQLHQPLSPAQQQKFDVYMMRRQGLNVPESMLEETSSSGKKKSGKASETEDEMDIQVKTMDVGKYNTINLQKELAEKVREVMPPEPQEKYGSMSEEAGISFAEPEQSYGEEESPELSGAYAGTGTDDFISREEIRQQTEAARQEALRQETEAAYENGNGTQSAFPAGTVSREEQEQPDLTQQQGQQGESADIGQMYVGSMKIEDIIREWEQMKRENEEKRRQELAQRVMEQTGPLFRDFDEAARQGTLERLQKEERIPVDRRRHESPEESVISARTKIWAASEVENALKAVRNGGKAETASAAAAASVPEAAAAEQASGLQAQAAAEPVSTPEAVPETIPAAAPVPAPETIPAAEPVSVPETIPTAEPVSVAEAVPAEATVPASQAVPVAEPDPTPQTAPQTTPAAPAAPGPEEIPQKAEVPEAADHEEPLTEAFAAAEETADDGETDDYEDVPVNTPEDVPVEPEEEAAEEPEDGQPESEPEEEETPEREEERIEAEIRAMSKEEKKMFASFVPTKSAMKKLVCALDRLSLAAYTGNLIITGDPGADSMDLVKKIVKDLKAKDRNFSGKLAKVTGSALNSSKGISRLVEKLEGGSLVIEEAGDIDRESMQKLLLSLNQERWGILVILVDTRRNMKKLLTVNPEMESFFNARFDIEALDNTMLAAYGCQYARMREYSVDELGRLALHTRIEDIQTSDHIVTVNDVRDIVDEAIDHANRKTPKHFIDVLFARRYDDDDMIILHEGDFI